MVPPVRGQIFRNVHTVHVRFNKERRKSGLFGNYALPYGSPRKYVIRVRERDTNPVDVFDNSSTCESQDNKVFFIKIGGTDIDKPNFI